MSCNFLPLLYTGYHSAGHGSFRRRISEKCVRKCFLAAGLPRCGDHAVPWPCCRLSESGATKMVSADSQRPPIHSFRSEEHTSELQSLMRNSYDVFCLKKK